MIEEGVTTIGDNAFCMFANLTSVTLPSSLTSIGSSAFADCSSLTSISIPGSVTSIGGGAFAGCTLLDGVQLPAHITAINYLLFQDCSSLTSIIIPEGVTLIDFGAFRNCTSLRFVYIPASVTSINANGMTYAPFYGCSAGLRIYCGASSALSSWDTYSFLLSNSSYTTPNYGYSLMDATYWPTLDTTETSIEIPEGITFLPNGAFSGCTNLTSVTLPSTLTVINSYAFSGCTALTSVYIPEGVTHIGEGAFQNCTALESIYIPSSVTFIYGNGYKYSPFYGCSSSLNIYCGASSNGSDWGTYWDYCASNSRLNKTYNYKAINFTYWNNLDESASVIRIPDDVTVIPNKAFENCTNLMEVYIPASVTSISATSSSGSPFVGRSSDLVIYCEAASRPSGWSTYWNYNVAGGTSSKVTTCWGVSQSDYNYWKSADSSAAVLSIPDGITCIPLIAFSGWQNLKAVYIPASVTKVHSTYLGVYPFTNCSTDLMVFCEAESMPSGWNSSWNGSVSHPVFGSSRTEFELFSQIDKTQTSITIPYGITRIPAYMFYQNQTLKKLVLPETVTTIEDFAFCQCSALESVTLPGSLTTIGISAFATCSNLSSVTIPDGVVSIGNNAFRYTGLDTVFIPKTVTTIGSYPWPTANTMVVYCEAESAQDGWGSNWSSNATVCYGFSAEDYAYWGAFDRNSSSVVIDDGVTMIPDNAFINFTNMTSVTIPDSVTSIGRNAFAGCTGLDTIFLPAGVTSISAADPSESPFYNLGYLRIYCEAESAPAGWETYWNYYKTDYVIPAEYGFTRQEYDFFTTLDKTATSIVIPDGMRFIPQLAFEGYTNLKSVYIPASVTTISVPSISEAPFLGLSDLVIYCAADSKPEGWDSLWNRYSAFSSSPLLSRFGCTLSDYNFWSNLDTSAAHIGIPNGITIIPTRAFYNCTALTSIDIPDSVTTIGDSAFSGCTSLTSIDLPDTVTAIGGGAFGGCTGLTSVEIPETVASIEDYTFQSCTGLTSFTIPAGVTSLGSRAFDGCTGITALYIPKTVETIAAYLFSYSDTTTPVVTVYCEAETAPAGWQTEWDNGCAVSFGCTTETFDYWTKQEHTGETIEIPAGITAIPENAFQNNTALKSVVIPESVTSIGANAFAGCSGLESVTIPGSVTAIGDNAFKDCAGLTSVTFCEGLESIGVSAFQGCTGLTKVVLPEGLLSIAQNSFRNCTSLASVYIPASVTTISIRNGTSYSPFYECSSLGTIYCGAATTPSGWGTYWNYISSARATVKYGWTNADYHFWTTVNESEEAIEIPAGVTLIPADAFSGCANLKSVTIPDSVTSIENYAFEDCTGLTSIFIPGSVEKMGYRLFDGCVSSLRVYCEADAMGGSWQGSWNSGLGTVPAYGTSRQEYGFWSTVDSSAVTVEIPDYIDNIPFNAFKDFKNLQSVTIPDGVTSIGDSAFYGCTALAEIDLPASLLTISDSAFRGCTALTEVVIPDGTTYIGFYAFKGCTALESVFIPTSVTELKAGDNYSAPFSDCGYDKLAIYCEAATEPEGWGSYWSVGSKCSYMGCTKQDYDFWCTLDNTEEIIEIPDGITFIPNDAFNGCAGLTGISIPDSVTKIGDRAFEGCTGLTEIALPAGLVSIGNSAFYHCTALEDIEIPGSVTSIGNAAFENCARITEVTIPDGVTSIGNDTFENCSSLRTVYIPASVTTIYQYAFNYCNNLTDIYFGHTASDELSILSGAFGTSYVSSITNYYPLTIHVPTIRDINTVLKNYTWSYRTITWDYTASIPVTEILLSEANNTTEIESGLELYFTAALTPADGTSELVWTVNNGGIVKTSDYITGTATIIGTETGLMTVRCESADDNYVFAEYQVNILPPTADVERITVRPDTPFPNEVEVGTTVQMIADIHPGNAANKEVTWTLVNGTGAAELDENGMLTALTTGTVTVRAYSTDGTEVVGSATINIVRYVDDIVLLFNGDPEKTQIGVGETFKVTFEHFPEDSSVKSVTWKVTNGTGSAVSGNSDSTYLYITGETPGTVTVTATANDSQRTSVSIELEVVGEKASYAVTGGNIYYNTVTGAIVDADSTVTAADIPARIKGLTITSIAPRAFVSTNSWGNIISNTTLTSVTIPSTVTYIGDQAFCNCTALADVELGSGVTTIGAEAFYYCQSLANLTIPESVTSVGKDAFYGASSLKNLTIPGDLDTRGWLYNYWNNVLETVTLTGDRVTGITPDNIHVNGSDVSMSGWDTMPGRNAKHVIVSDSVTSIDSYAFLDCGKIEKVTMGTGVTFIGDLAFYWCNSLREINLPEGLTHVGKQAFGGVAASLFDMSKIPDSITQQDFPLTDDLVVVPEILIHATEGKVNFYWHVWEIEGETGSAGIAHYSVDDRRLVIYEPGKVELICIDEYTGARGSKIINCELGLEIEGLYNNYLTSGEKVTLTARRMPAGTEESVTWSLRAQDKYYASLSATSGKSTTLTAKKVTQATQIQVTATSDDPNDAPETRTIWILPETATITITDAATGEVLGKTGSTVKTIPVDLRTGSMTLSGAVTPEDASKHVFWGTSNYNIAEVDYDGVITFKMPGTATITAFASDTSGKTASFKLQVYYVDPAEKLTASADVPTYGLEVLDSVPIHVFGTDKQNPLNPADLTYYIPDEQLEIATIDEETGILTAGERTGTVVVTAAIKGDPLARSVSIKVKVIPAQTASVFLTTPENDISKVLMLDPNGEVTTDPAQAARYRVYLDKEQMLSGGFAFPVNAAATDSNGNPMTLSATSMKWATTDKRIATVTANSDGTALVTVKAKIDGACVITATSTDLAKVEGMLEIFVRDYSPRLESTSLTMNSNLLSGVTVGLKPAYDAQIESEVEVLEYAKATKTYKPTDRFDAVYEDGKLRITSADVVKKGSYKLKVCGNVIKEDGIAMPYEKALTLKVSNKLPSVSVKQKAKFNLFYTDSAAPIAITAKNQTIEKVEISGTTSFKVGEFHRETSLADVVFTKEYVDGTAGKLDTKINILVYLEGYRVPVKKALTLSTTTAKPSVSLTPASGIINTATAGEHSTAFRVFNKTTGEYMDVLPEDISASFATVDIDEGLVTLTLNEDSVIGKKGVSATVTLQESNWMKPIKLTHKVTVQRSLPTVKFSPSTLKLNRVFTKQTASTTVSLSQQNMTLGSFTIEPADKKASTRTQAAKVLFDIDGNVITARLDQENLPKSGTYTFRVNATLDDGVTALVAKTFKVTVGSTVPTVKLKTPTLKLNKKLGKDHAIACSGFSMSKGAGYEFVRFDLPANWSSNDISVRYDETDGMVYATLHHDNALTGKHTIALTPVLRHVATGEVAALPTTVKLTVQVESKTPSVTVTAKGKLDATLPDSAITYTVKSFSNVPGTPDDISLSGTHGDLFKATLDTSGTKPVVTLKMAEGVKYNPKTTYKVTLVFQISGQMVKKSVSFKVAQTTLKLKSVPTMRLYQFQSAPMTAQITVTVPAGASIEQITLSSKTPYQFRRALGAGNMKVDYLEDGNALVTFDFAHPGYLTYGKSYTVYLDVTPVSTAQTVKKTQLKFTVKSYK